MIRTHTKTEMERLISFQRSASVKAGVETNGGTDTCYQFFTFLTNNASKQT